LIKIVAIVLGVLALAGTILIAVADASQKHSNAMGPVAFLACIIAVAVMILLGVTLGGRGNPRRNPDGSVKPSRAELQHLAAQRANSQAQAVTTEPGDGGTAEPQTAEADQSGAT
jgi:hypothetical protein